jgi:hypothetical protein
MLFQQETNSSCCNTKPAALCALLACAAPLLAFHILQQHMGQGGGIVGGEMSAVRAASAAANMLLSDQPHMQMVAVLMLRADASCWDTACSAHQHVQATAACMLSTSAHQHVHAQHISMCMLSTSACAGHSCRSHYQFWL